MAEIKREFVKAKLCTANPEDWFVYYSILNPETNQWKRFRKRMGINRIKNKRSRTIEANILVEAINESLVDGTLNPLRPGPDRLPLIDCLIRESDLKKGSLRRKTWQSYVYGANSLSDWLEKN